MSGVSLGGLGVDVEEALRLLFEKGPPASPLEAPPKRRAFPLHFSQSSQPDKPIQPLGALIEPGAPTITAHPWADDVRGVLHVIR